MSSITFLCVGTQKGGTTSLHDILVQHPEICLPYNKETKFFIEDYRFNEGLEFYLSFFRNCAREDSLWGEVDPDYMYFKKAVKRIYTTLGSDIKLIFIFRNPVERAYSHYLMSLGRGIEDRPFEETIALERKRIEQGDFYRHHFSYFERGFYFKQVSEFLKYFPKENMFFMVFEKFIAEKESVMKELLKFIGVKDYNYRFGFDIHSNASFAPKLRFLNKILFQPTVLNRITRKIIPYHEHRRKLKRSVRMFIESINKKPLKNKKLNADIRTKLMNTYVDDIRELENFTGIDLSIWLADGN